MRLIRTSLVGLLLCAVAVPAAAQFNPQGRSKKPKGAQTTKPAARPSGASKPQKPAAGTGATAEPRADPSRGAEPKGPSTDALIARYMGIVLSQPGVDFPLQRLAELYRSRDGNIDALVAELEKRAADPGANRYNALVALAGVYKLDSMPDRAIATYERAITEQPRNPIGLSALARLLVDRGDKAGARKRFEQALAETREDAAREQILRLLMGLALDLKDFEGAKRYHKDLVNRARGSFFVRAELGRELLNRNEYDKAVTEFQSVVQAAAGDNRVLAPALRDYGRALAKVGRHKEAIRELERALAAAGESGVRREIYDTIVDIYRKQDRLPELVAKFEKDPAPSVDELRLLASLYEETGQMEKALATYRKALGRDGKDIATRLKLVHLLEVRGELDAAIKEYDALIRAAPRNPDFVFQLAEALIQRGDRQKALEHLKRLEARSQNDEETLAALVDFYERVEEKDRALSLLQRLAGAGTQDPQHLAELGARYWQQGDKKKALATWQRIKTAVPDRAQALLTLGEIYLEHDMPKEALEALGEAMKLAPKQARFKKAYALALERTAASGARGDAQRVEYDEARKIWEQLLREAGSDANLAREARQHIITLYSLSGQLAQRLGPLARRLAANPPDLEAGRLLAEGEIRLNRHADAERTLRKIVSLQPGDIESLTRLERVLVLSRKLNDAIEVLERLATADPKRAREYYQRMAGYAAELYQDDRALAYAARAVELSPDDAEGHKKLGQMYRQRQETQKAIGEFRQALSKNERLFPVYLELAELLLGQGAIDEADLLLRRVVRAAPDEELVYQAARLSMQVNLGRGTLESLERDLLPVALNNPQRPIFRQLLVEIYGAMAYPLLHRVRNESGAEAERAREALKKLGERAVKPLLDALSDPREAQQQVAITLLTHVENRDAGPALLAYASGSADAELRTRAMIAVGALRDPKLLPKLGALLMPGGEARADESDPVVVAAAWAVARLRSPAASPLLSKLLDSEAPSLRTLAAIGLGLLKERRALPALSRTARSLETGPLPRAAAAFAIGEIGQSSEASALAELVEASDPTLRASAILALARLGAEAAEPAVAEALISPDPMLQAAGSYAALVLTTSEYRAVNEPLPVPEGRVDLRAILDGLRPGAYRPEEQVRAVQRLAPAIARASRAAAQSSPDRARAVADVLRGREGRPPFAFLTRDVGPEHAAVVERVAREIALELVPAFAALSRHPSAEVRIFAVRFLSAQPNPEAKAALLSALGDRDESVKRAVLSTLERGALDAVKPLIQLFAAERDWSMRAATAEALGRVAEGTANPEALRALGRAAESDPYALVREAALRALARVGPREARPVLERARDKDAEPRVKALAKTLLEAK